MAELEDLLRKRRELLSELDRKIADTYAKPVTLLFTDIVGSTEFFETAGDIAGRQMIQTHNDLLFPEIEAKRGRIIKTIGDSIMASFDDPRSGVECSIRMQEVLSRHNGELEERERIKVRMGLHYGRAVMEERDLFGDMVNTAARVESKADGEEILISGELKEQLSGDTIPLLFLGSEAVKGKKRRIDFYLVNWNRKDEKLLLESWRHRQKPGAKAEDPAAAPSHPPAVLRRRLIFRGTVDLEKEAEKISAVTARGNPYLNRVMIPHPSMFFGREGTVRRIMGRIGAQQPQSVSIVGERRIGKSSLLNHLFCPLTRLRGLPEPRRYLFLFVDFQQLRSIDETRFIALLYEGLQKNLGPLIDLDLEPDRDGFRFLCEELTRQDHRLVLLFDEFESVTKNSRIGADFYSFLRSMANNYPLCFVTASGRNLKDMCVSHEIADSPFFNIFSVVNLGLFREEEAKLLVREPSQGAGIPLDPLEAGILTSGGFYPFFLQICCSAWFDYLEAEGLSAEGFRDRPEPREVTELFREEAESHFEFVLETFPSGEAEAMRKIAEGSEPDPVHAGILERKGYAVPGPDGTLRPFSEEFRRFVKTFRNP